MEFRAKKLNTTCVNEGIVMCTVTNKEEQVVWETCISYKS